MTLVAILEHGTHICTSKVFACSSLWRPQAAYNQSVRHMLACAASCLHVNQPTVMLPLCDAADQQLLQRKRQLEMNTLSAAGGGAMATLQVC